ncbi:His/Gly/Thr/Pro-type tRNA ligase C-terminal domain-containing protein [bacterium]|nr:His/Gly/Thr/Pro-type tRNA ligase C-terminal domain-containing protein [bacterium]
MRQSELFTKTRKEAPKDEVSKNAGLLIRGGFVRKEMAGVYSYLPLGLRVLKKIETVIREEMDALGGQEVLLTTLQDPEIWQKSGRWQDDAVDIWFKTSLKNGHPLGVANTHEEALVNLLRDHISSYRDLPLYAYQIQTKFRNELRAKSGIMRCREFLMKDLYSFSRSEAEFREFYEHVALSYMNIFGRAGLGGRTYRTFASGGSFSKWSDEFQTICDAGEDTIYVDKEKNIAVNDEVYDDDVLAELGLNKERLVKEKAIEVGNIFPLGTKYAEALGLAYKDESGNVKTPVMGSYGIGLGRLMGAVVEALSDERGIVWPESIAPFRMHLISLGKNAESEKIYKDLSKNAIETLYDDRDARAGEKLSDADLIGIPYRIVISEKSIAEGGAEIKKRDEKESRVIGFEEILHYGKKNETMVK